MQTKGRFRSPNIVIDNTDIEILEKLLMIYGGSLVAKRRQADHHRQAWSWRLYGANQIISFLRIIEPYMMCAAKKARARMLIDRYKSVTPRNGRYTDEMIQEKVQFEDEFMAIGAGRGSGGTRVAT